MESAGPQPELDTIFDVAGFQLTKGTLCWSWEHRKVARNTSRTRSIVKRLSDMKKQ
jgi:hypothetical protein